MMLFNRKPGNKSKFPSRRILSRFQRSETGAVTIEMSLWLPFFILFLFAVGEFGLMFNGQARVLGIAQDTNRGISTGRFDTAADAEEWVVTALGPLSDEVVATTTINKGLITTAITISAADLAGNIGIFSMLADFDLIVTAQQVLEYEL